MRWQARASRLALYGMLAVLAFVGLRSILAGRAATLPLPRHATTARQAADPAGFAEAFVRAYLTYDPRRQDEHAAALRAFLTSDVDPDAGLSPDPNSHSRVVWTAVAGETRDARDHSVVTVATAIDGQSSLVYVAVPIARRPVNAFIVDRYPAFVGPPPTDSSYQPPTGDDVADSALAAVVKRALSNYLAGATDNLRADLAGPIGVTPPSERLELDSVDSLTWVGRGRVAAQVVARGPAGNTYTFRYELAVVKRDRWYVLGLNPPAAPAAEEGANQ